jgi:hypothetical protein
VPLSLSLAAPALLQGGVVNEGGSPVSGVRIIAITRTGIGSAVESQTDAAGEFSLPVIRGAVYTVMLMPNPSTSLARQVLDAVWVDQAVTRVTGQGAAGAVILPAGLSISGQVVYQSHGLSGVLIQAIPSGVAGEPVLAEDVTDAAGRFALVVPDPGLAE